MIKLLLLKDLSRLAYRNGKFQFLSLCKLRMSCYFKHSSMSFENISNYRDAKRPILDPIERFKEIMRRRPVFISANFKTDRWIEENISHRSIPPDVKASEEWKTQRVVLKNLKTKSTQISPKEQLCDFEHTGLTQKTSTQKKISRDASTETFGSSGTNGATVTTTQHKNRPF